MWGDTCVTCAGQGQGGSFGSELMQSLLDTTPGALQVCPLHPWHHNAVLPLHLCWYAPCLELFVALRHVVAANWVT